MGRKKVTHAIMVKKMAEPPKAIMVTGVRLGWKSLSLRTPPTRQKRMVLMLPRDMTEVEAAASRPEAGQEEGGRRNRCRWRRRHSRAE